MGFSTGWPTEVEIGEKLEEELKEALLKEFFNGFTEIHLRNPLTNETKSLEIRVSWSGDGPKILSDF